MINSIRCHYSYTQCNIGLGDLTTMMDIVICCQFSEISWVSLYLSNLSTLEADDLMITFSLVLNFFK